MLLAALNEHMVTAARQPPAAYKLQGEGKVAVRPNPAAKAAPAAAASLAAAECNTQQPYFLSNAAQCAPLVQHADD